MHADPTGSSTDAGLEEPGVARPTLFDDYELQERYYDEMFAAPGEPRPHCHALIEALAELPAEELGSLQQRVNRALLHEGITFTVYGNDESIERVFPVDCVPRLVPAADWEHIERGLIQRVQALNLFLADVYGKGSIVRDGVVPEDLLRRCPNYRPEMEGVKVPLDAYVSVCGSDIVRTHDGFMVLEDNLRVPSGVSYMLACRQAIRRAWPRVFRGYRVRPVERYATELLRVLRSLAPNTESPTIALLTPGIYNSAYYEHAFLASEMDIELVRGDDLTVQGNRLHMRTTRGLRPVDVLYRRIDDDFIDPTAFRADSMLGVPGLFDVYRKGGLAMANAPGTGVADDKAVYAFVPRMIRYYLGEEPVLPNVETHLCREPEGLAYTLDHLDEVVVKAVGESPAATTCWSAPMPAGPNAKPLRTGSAPAPKTTFPSRRWTFPGRPASSTAASSRATSTSGPSCCTGRKPASYPADCAGWPCARAASW